MVEQIERSTRYPLKFRIGTLTVGITKHARYRGGQREIDWQDKLAFLVGKTPVRYQGVDEYQSEGIISRYNGEENFLAIVTVYNCK